MLRKIKREKILYLFFLLQPLISVYRTLWRDNIKLFGFSFFEMLNTFFIIGLWFYVLCTTKTKKALYIIPYFIILGIYCIVHYFNISHFNTEILDRNIYGIVQESYYIFRVYGLPILLLFCLFLLKLQKEFYLNTICSVAFLVGIIVVLSNFMGVSLCTYTSEGHTHLIQGSFFSWFTTNGTEEMERYTSSGLFSSGNEISGLLLMTLPIVTYRFLRKIDIKGTVCLIVVMLAMLMIGTKTATIGSGMIFFFVLIIYMIIEVMKRNYSYLKRWGSIFLTALVLWGGLFYYSPYLQEEFPHYSGDEVATEEKEEERVTKPIQLSDETQADREEALKYIKNNYWNHFVNEQYIKLYPVEKDLSFWINIINREAGLNQNYRAFKQELIERVIERNNRVLDPLVGIGVLHEIDCEKDYVSQYYTFGIVGVILLLGIYIFILLKNCFLFLRHIKLFWKKDFVIYMCALGISILLPYVTGHMIGIVMSMFQMILLILLVQCTIAELRERDNINRTI